MVGARFFGGRLAKPALDCSGDDPAGVRPHESHRRMIRGGGLGIGSSGLGGMSALREQQRALRALDEGPPPPVRRTLRRVWGCFRPYRWQLTLGTLLTLGGVGLTLIPPLLIRALIDQAIPTGNLRLALLLSFGIFLLPLGSAILGLGQTVLSARVAQGVIADLRSRLYRHLQTLGLDFFTWTRAGEIQSRFVNDAGGLQNVLTQAFLGTFANLLTVVGILIVMLLMDWRLTLAALVALPSFALPVLYFGRRRYEAVQRVQAALAELSIVLEETLSLSGAIVVKSFGMEPREASRFDRVNTMVRETQIQQVLTGQWLSVLVQGLAALGPALLYAFGAYLIITQQVALGTVVAFATYLGQLYQPASSLAGANATLLGGLALFDRVFQLLDVRTSVPEAGW
jgi:ATP-binding cassette subfamily B protein